MNTHQKAIVIGAGAGGTSIAAFLAKNGFDVTVLEKNSFVGGVCSNVESNGHRFDRGPFMVLFYEMYERIFKELGEEFSDHIEILEASGILFHFADGTSFELSPDFAKVCEQVERFEGKRNMKSKLLQFFAESQNSVDLIHELSGENNVDNFINYRNIASLVKHFKWHFFSSVKNRVSKYFKNEKLREIFTMLSPFGAGMSPTNTPSLFNFLVALYALEKYRYPKNGMHTIVKALENIASNKFGAKFIYNASVAKINVNEEKTATGVTLGDGRVMNADVVVCNADVTYAYNKLLPQNEYGTKLAESFVQADGGIVIYWSLRKRVDEFKLLNVFIPENFFCSFAYYRDNNWSHKRTFSLFLPNRIDETAAPKDKDSVMVYFTIGRLRNNISKNFEPAIERARKYVIETIEQRLKIEDFESLIENEIIVDPNEWTERFNYWNCSLLGMSMIANQLCPFRPPNRSHLFNRLYFIGVSTHPGIGVFANVFAGKVVANRITSDLNGNRDRCSMTKMVTLSLIVILFAYLCSDIYFKMS